MTWDPHYGDHIVSIEKIQRQALRWIFNEYMQLQSQR